MFEYTYIGIYICLYTYIYVFIYIHIKVVQACSNVLSRLFSSTLLMSNPCFVTIQLVTIYTHIVCDRLSHPYYLI